MWGGGGGVALDCSLYFLCLKEWADEGYARQMCSILFLSFFKLKKVS